MCFGLQAFAFWSHNLGQEVFCFPFQFVTNFVLPMFKQVKVEFLAGSKNWLADHLSRKDEHWKTVRCLDADKEWAVPLDEIVDPIL